MDAGARVTLCTKYPKKLSMEHAKIVASVLGKSAFVSYKCATFKKALAHWKPRHFSLHFFKLSVAIVCTELR